MADLIRHLDSGSKAGMTCKVLQREHLCSHWKTAAVMPQRGMTLLEVKF